VAPARLPQTAEGFTLIELLVVITILGILALGVIAGSQRTLVRSRSVGCLSHLRQWGIATSIHAIDHDDRLPHDGAPNGISTRDAWYIDLPRAVGIPTYPQEGSWRTNPSVNLPYSIWICPANRRRSNGRILFHYCLNRRVNGSGSGPRQSNLTAFQDPARLVWMFDNGRLAAVAAENNSHTNAHGAGAHFLFLDGHVQWLRHTQYWDATRRRAITNSETLRWFP
jgi:prepilin-type N-terminal cleavage/methylation domain-containing protein/prepilin-type processing-associated H-X9-DG protein